MQPDAPDEASQMSLVDFTQKLRRTTSESAMPAGPAVENDPKFTIKDVSVDFYPENSSSPVHLDSPRSLPEDGDQQAGEGPQSQESEEKAPEDVPRDNGAQVSASRSLNSAETPEGSKGSSRRGSIPTGVEQDDQLDSRRRSSTSSAGKVRKMSSEGASQNIITVSVEGSYPSPPQTSSTSQRKASASSSARRTSVPKSEIDVASETGRRSSTSSMNRHSTSVHSKSHDDNVENSPAQMKKASISMEAGHPNAIFSENVRVEQHQSIPDQSPELVEQESLHTINSFSKKSGELAQDDERETEILIPQPKRVRCCDPDTRILAQKQAVQFKGEHCECCSQYASEVPPTSSQRHCNGCQHHEEECDRHATENQEDADVRNAKTSNGRHCNCCEHKWMHRARKGKQHCKSCIHKGTTRSQTPPLASNFDLLSSTMNTVLASGIPVLVTGDPTTNQIRDAAQAANMVMQVAFNGTDAPPLQPQESQLSILETGQPSLPAAETTTRVFTNPPTFNVKELSEKKHCGCCKFGRQKSNADDLCERRGRVRYRLRNVLVRHVVLNALLGRDIGTQTKVLLRWRAQGKNVQEGSFMPVNPGFPATTTTDPADVASTLPNPTVAEAVGVDYENEIVEPNVIESPGCEIGVQAPPSTPKTPAVPEDGLFDPQTLDGAFTPASDSSMVFRPRYTESSLAKIAEGIDNSDQSEEFMSQSYSTIR